MNTAAVFHPAVLHPAAPHLNRSVERLRGALLWLTGFAGAIVMMEPSPYEIASLLTIFVFVCTGLTLRPGLLPLFVLLLLYNTGFSIAVLQITDQSKPTTWVAISWYLSLTAIFFAAMLSQNTEERLALLLRGTTVAALLAAVIAILSYFRLLGSASDLFLLYDRAHATFNDPNVLGAFLILPSLLALQRILNGRLGEVARASVLLGLFSIAVLLSFSRAAWGQLAGASALLMFFTFVTSRSPAERLRIMLIAIAAIMVITLVLAAVLSLDRVAELFKERFALEQSYDMGPLGRFGRYALGAGIALDHPLGIGPLQFQKLFPEDPHNTYLNTFLSGGWLTGMVYATLVLTTLVRGLAYVFVATPWRKTYLAVYCAFVGTVVESAIIDIDHWRHFFLIIGVVWGLMTVSQPYRRGRRLLRPLPHSPSKTGVNALLLGKGIA
ncbi:MAG TPA: O-antigen ligase family protein [Xanthobacteraceae bacterium]|nr:O-antigen ligase family protein [Xanthobacteraceae bacterium]